MLTEYLTEEQYRKELLDVLNEAMEAYDTFCNEEEPLEEEHVIIKE